MTDDTPSGGAKVATVATPAASRTGSAPDKNGNPAFVGSGVTIAFAPPKARDFWEKMGVPQQNVAEGDAYDGTLNWSTYLEAQTPNRRRAL